MGRLHTAGCTGALATAKASEFSSAVGSPTRSTTVVPPGSLYSCRIGDLASGTKQAVDFYSLVTSTNWMYWRWKFRLGTAPSATNFIAGCSTTALTVGAMRVSLTSAGALSVYQDTTVLFTSSALSVNTWYRVEIGFLQGAAGTGRIILRIDGTDVYDSGVSRTFGGTLDQWHLGGNLAAEAQTQGEWWFADMALNDDQGSTQTSWPGAGCITYLRPTGAGTYDVSFTANGAGTNPECVDEVDPDNATTYANGTVNSTSWSVGARLLMACTNAADAGIGSSDVITLIGIGVVWSSATAATSTVQPGYRSGGTDVDAGTARVMNLTTDSFIDDTPATAQYSPRYTDPAAADWTPTTLDSLEIGCRATDTSPNTRVTTIWALVEYVPAVASGQPAKRRMGSVSHIASHRPIGLSGVTFHAPMAKAA